MGLADGSTGRTGPVAVVFRGVSRAQKIALIVVACVLVALGFVVAFKLGSDSNDGSGSSAGSSSSVPSTPASSPASSPSGPLVSLVHLGFSNGPISGGRWGTGIALTFTGARPPQISAAGQNAGVYDFTFDQPVSVAPSVIAQANVDGDPILLKLGWDDGSQTLSVTVEAYTQGTMAIGADGASLQFVRTPAPATQHDCIQIDQPVPFTKLYGITTVSGKAQLFEAGPMTVVAAVPGAGQKQVKVKTSTGDAMVPFTTQVELPLLDQPAEGTISAYDLSAKDGSKICTVTIPVYMSPGG